MKHGNQTEQLYNDLLQNNSLYPALLNYAKDYDADVYHKYTQDNKKSTIDFSDQQEQGVSKKALLKLLSQQSENIHELNDLIKQIKLSEQQVVSSKALLELLNQQGGNIHELNELLKQIV